jgi:general secretion pathway protein A
MEEIRMLSNWEAEKSHLIQILLVGQPHLNIKLQRPDLEQFSQRVSVHYHLDGLAKIEVGPYIKYRLEAGGAQDSDIFTSEAIETVGEYSFYNPRIINTMCDNALVYGFADASKIIDKSIIDQVIAAREGAELFSPGEHKGKNASSRSPSDSANLPSLDKRLQAIETKLGSIELILDKLQQLLDTSTKKKE